VKLSLVFYEDEAHIIVSLLLSCASWNSEGRHLVVVENLLKFGIDFSASPAPQFESWPKPCPDDQAGEFSRPVIPPDPFFVEFLTAILRTNQGTNLFNLMISYF
jgi:hypothetical protein